MPGHDALARGESICDDVRVSEDIQAAVEHGLRTDVPDLVEFATNTEGSQSYLWAYIDYCFRTPIYRTLQWLDCNLRNQNFWKLIAEDGEGREFLKSLITHILKEYTLMWSRIMDGLADMLLGESRERGELPEVVREVLGPDVKDGTALFDLKGIATELKAFYVLIDHRKPFLPFSIMQSPITPSYIRPGASSGDLYLFEENLIVDVKSGQLDGKELPTYYHGREANLSADLKKASNMRNLYGIRKGIGVVADEGGYIHLAVYVPWKRWMVEGPLLHLKSLKLPLLAYVNNIGRTGVAHHGATLGNGKLRLTVKAYDLRESPYAGKPGGITLSFLRNPGVVIEGSVNRDSANPRRVTVEFAVDTSKVKDSIVTDVKSGKSVVLAKLLVQYGEEEEKLVYPLLAATD